jgi:S-adenosylmethionine decarboxylase proenzyme
MRHDHLLCDLWFSEDDQLKYVDPLRTILLEAAEAGGAVVYHVHFHQFLPWGVTGFLLLKESHISLHTWVEERYAALDIFPCGAMDSRAIVQYLVDRLRPRQVNVLQAERGRSEAQIVATNVRHS